MIDARDSKKIPTAASHDTRGALVGVLLVAIFQERRVGDRALLSTVQIL
jgi:hypothetical protein